MSISATRAIMDAAVLAKAGNLSAALATVDDALRAVASDRGSLALLARHGAFLAQHAGNLHLASRYADMALEADDCDPLNYLALVAVLEGLGELDRVPSLLERCRQLASESGNESVLEIIATRRR